MSEPLQLTEARLSLVSLILFRGLRSDPAVRAFMKMLDGATSERAPAVWTSAYADFVGALYERDGNWSRLLLNLVLRDENRYMQLAGAGEEIPACLEAALERELAILERLSRVDSAWVAAELHPAIPLPAWETAPLDFAAAYRERLRDVRQVGYGVFSDYHMFLLRGGKIVPVKHPDPVRFDNLTGYKRERGRVLDNTLALLEGRPAANILLYGDSGTGKSTCVKAVANELHGRGLRLIELGKEQLDQIPLLLDRLYGNPLKFILFIDDLSFGRGDNSYSAMKAVLEGSVSAKTSNIVIYATSNRRHLLQEAFADREGDEVHLRDSLEEASSLSDRFGLLVTFLRPDRDLYLAIVERYCAQRGIPYNEAIRQGAEAFALRRGGRSARAARQFAESLSAQ